MLNDAVRNRTLIIVNSKNVPDTPGKKEFNPDLLETDDMATVHEAFQFLIRKFVESDEGQKSGLLSGSKDLQRQGRRSPSVQSIKSLNTRRGSNVSMTSITSTRNKSAKLVFLLLCIHCE